MRLDNCYHLEYSDYCLYLYCYKDVIITEQGFRSSVYQKPTFIVYHRTNVLCCKERSPQKKKYSNSKVREENIAVIFIQLWSLQLEKFLLLPSSRWWRGVCEESWLFDTCLLQQIGHSRLGYDGSGPPEPLTHPFWQLPSTLPKSHYLLYRDFGEQIEDPRMFDVTSETRDDTSVIILKSRLCMR